MKFVTDGMLGKITRWLRMLGFNVEYGSDSGDKALLEIAKSEERILLTRDVQLFQKSKAQHVDAFLVEGRNNIQRLAAVSKRFDLKLELDPNFSRCPMCNAQIAFADKNKISNKLPYFTKLHYDEFWKCSKCGKIYWKGAHWKRINETIEEVNRLLEKRGEN